MRYDDHLQDFTLEELIQLRDEAQAEIDNRRNTECNIAINNFKQAWARLTELGIDVIVTADEFYDHEISVHDVEFKRWR